MEKKETHLSFQQEGSQLIRVLRCFIFFTTRISERMKFKKLFGCILDTKQISFASLPYHWPLFYVSGIKINVNHIRSYIYICLAFLSGVLTSIYDTLQISLASLPFSFVSFPFLVYLVIELHASRRIFLNSSLVVRYVIF